MWLPEGCEGLTMMVKEKRRVMGNLLMKSKVKQVASLINLKHTMKQPYGHGLEDIKIMQQDIWATFFHLLSTNESQRQPIVSRLLAQVQKKMLFNRD